MKYILRNNPKLVFLVEDTFVKVFNEDSNYNTGSYNYDKITSFEYHKKKTDWFTLIASTIFNLIANTTIHTKTKEHISFVYEGREIRILLEGSEKEVVTDLISRLEESITSN